MNSSSISLLKMNMFALIFVSTLVLSVYGQKDDGLCPYTRNILCVNEVLLDILAAAKEINVTAEKIEQSIYGTHIPRSTLEIYSENRLKSIRAHLPSKYHQFIFAANNINRTGLIKLIQEEHTAFSYILNSIENIFKMDGDSRVDSQFKKIFDILRKDIICNYRNILHTYAGKWTSFDQISGLKMPKKGSITLMYYAQSIVITRLLREWIAHINEVTSTIKSKLS